MEHDNAFDVLEQKVRKAADTLRRLRSDKDELERERTKLRASVQELEKRVATLEKQGRDSAAGSQKLHALSEEVEALRTERTEIRRRIARLVEVLDGLE